MRKLLAYTAALAAVLISLPALAQSPGNYVGGSTSVYNQQTPPADRVLVNQTISSAQTGCTASGAISLRTTGLTTVAVTITGSFVATLNFAAAADNNTTFNGVFGIPQAGGAVANAARGPGVWFIPVTGYRGFCIYASSYTSGTATISLEGSAAYSQPSVSPLATPTNQNITQWLNQPALLGPGLSNVPGQGVTPRVSLSRDANPRVIIDDTLPTYRCSAQFTPQATAPVTVISMRGSATAPVRIRKILMSGTAAALGISVFQMQRTTALGAGGTTVSPTIATLDTNFASAGAGALCSHYTTSLKAAGTASGGPLGTWVQFFDTVTTPTVATRLPDIVFPEGGVPGQSIVLRGTGDFLEIQNVTPTNFGTTTVISYTIEWVEDNTFNSSVTP